MKRKYFSIATLLVFICLCCCEYGTESFVSYGNIKGQVIDYFTNRIIPSARIYTIPESKSVLTDLFGNYELDSLLVGEYKLICQKAGYYPNTQMIMVLPDSVIVKDFNLNHNDLFAATDSLQYHFSLEQKPIRMTVQNSSDSIKYILHMGNLIWEIEKFDSNEWKSFSSSIHLAIYGLSWVEIPISECRDYVFIHYQSHGSGRFRIKISINNTYVEPRDIYRSNTGYTVYSNEYVFH